MSRATHDDRVYALFDVLGTGFRDREGTGMFTQYHKMGWQKDFRSEDSPENQYDLTYNPVVVLGLPQHIDVNRIRERCEARFGAVARVHRPTKVVREPRVTAPIVGDDARGADFRAATGAPSSPPLLESFAIVEFVDETSAAKATRDGTLELANEETTRSDANERPHQKTEKTEEDARASSERRGVFAAAKIAPRKTLVADVARWRRDVRASFRQASEARLPFRNVGPSDDPTDWCNAGNAFKRTFPELSSRAE